MPEENINQEILPDEPSDDEGSVDESSKPLYKVLGETLGKDFKSDEAALKSIKDTQQMVGKVGKYSKALKTLENKLGGDQELAKNLNAQAFETEVKPESPEKEVKEISVEEQVQDILFYKENPKLVPYKKIIEGLKSDTAPSAYDVLKLDEFKPFSDFAGKQDEKSVIMSKTRVGQATDKIDEAKQMLSKGDIYRAEDKAVDAVLESIAEAKENK